MKQINRRRFIGKSITIGGVSIGLSIIPKFLRAGSSDIKSDIYTITAEHPKESIPMLIESLGGIEKFVKNGDSVGFLVNSPWVHKGFYTNPDIVLVAMKMCKDAGAKEIICYKPVRDGYWEESQYYEEMKPLIDEIIYGDERVEIDIKGGKEMQSAEVFQDIYGIRCIY